MAVLLPFAVSACGSEENSSATSEGELPQRDSGSTGAAAREAKADLRAYLSARLHSNYRQACSYLAESIRKTCKTRMRAAAAGSPPSAFELGRVSVAGKRGIALYTEGGDRHAMPLLAEGGHWRPTAIVGTPLRPRTATAGESK